MTHLKASLLLYAVLCAQVADWGSTLYAMTFGAYEANPLMAPLFDISPYVALVPKLLVVCFCLGTYLLAPAQDKGKMLWWLVGCLLISAFPVVWNVIQLMRAGLL